ESLGVATGDLYQTMQTYLGSSFVNLFTRFGHNYMVFAQADAPYRLEPNNLSTYHVRNQSGDMVPVAAVAAVKPTQGAAIIPLYNLLPSATINGSASDAFSSGQGLATMEAIAARALPAGMSYEWTAMSYQEKLAGNFTWLIFVLALLLVYLVLAG